MFDLHQFFCGLLFLSNKSETEELLGAAVFSTVVPCSQSLVADLFVSNSSPVHVLEAADVRGPSSSGGTCAYLIFHE